ncbi:MAG: hypothetical protein H0X45_01080 [Planctomycetes bacterium]|nr:hypothetical protein [Planctomycetota bacterium]
MRRLAHFASRSLAIAVLAMTSSLISLAQLWYVVTALGLNSATDAFFISGALPQFITAAFGNSLVTALLPALTGDRADADRRARSAMIFVMLVIVSLAALFALLMPWWAPLIAAGLPAEAHSTLIACSRLQLLAMVGTHFSLVASTHLQARERHVRIHATQAFATLCSLGVTIAMVPHLGASGAALAIAARPWIECLGYPDSLMLMAKARSNGYWRELWTRTRGLCFAASYYKSDLLLDRFLASFAPAGDLSLLNMATRLNGVASQIVTRSLATPLVPPLAATRDADGMPGVRARARRSMLFLSGAGLLCALGLIALGRTGFAGLFAINVFVEQDADRLWILSMGLLGVLAISPLGFFLSSACFIIGRGDIVTRTGVVGFTAAICLKIALFQAMGILGIALATSAFFIGVAFAKWVWLERAMARK